MRELDCILDYANENEEEKGLVKKDCERYRAQESAGDKNKLNKNECKKFWGPTKSPSEFHGFQAKINRIESNAFASFVKRRYRFPVAASYLLIPSFIPLFYFHPLYFYPAFTYYRSLSRSCSFRWNSELAVVEVDEKLTKAISLRKLVSD